MEENTMQTEATSAAQGEWAQSAQRESPGGQDWQDAEFEKAFDEQDATSATESEEGQGEWAQSAQRKPPGGQEHVDESPHTQEKAEMQSVLVDGKAFTADDVSALIGRIGELQARINTPPQERELLESLAISAGMDVEDFLLHAEEMLVGTKTQARVAQLMEQGVPPEVAQHTASLERELAAKEAERKLLEARKNTNATRDMREEAFRSQIREFEEKFPDVGMPPEEVFRYIEQTGASPVEAYQHYLLKQREKELTRLKQEQKNRVNTPGGVKGRGLEKEDPFLAELMK